MTQNAFAKTDGMGQRAVLKRAKMNALATEFARKMQRVRVQRTGMERIAPRGAVLMGMKQTPRVYPALVMAHASSPMENASVSPVSLEMLASSSLAVRTAGDYAVRASASAFQALVVRTAMSAPATMTALAMEVAHLTICVSVRMDGQEKAVS